MDYNWDTVKYILVKRMQLYPANGPRKINKVPMISNHLYNHLFMSVPLTAMVIL